MLRLNNITKIYSGTVALKNVTIEVPQGIVKGIIGKNGAGKTTLVGIMSGIISPTEGEILLNEKHFRALSRQKARKEGIAIVTQEAEIIPDWTVAENLFVPDFICSWNGQTIKWKKSLRFKSPNRAISAGVVYLTEDRDKEGLVDILSVKDNLTMSTLKALSKFAILNKRKEKEISAHLVNLLSVQTPSYNEIVENLSGGNRQKVMLGRTIATKPSVYLLDEPTKGIDISAKREIMSFVRTDLSKNSGVILTSPDIPGLIEICDRIFVLYKGKIVSIFNKNEFNEASIYNATQGMVAIDENLNKNTNSYNQEV